MERYVSLRGSWWRALLLAGVLALGLHAWSPHPAFSVMFVGALLMLIFRSGARSGLAPLGPRSAILVPGAAVLSAGLVLFDQGDEEWVRLATILAVTGGQVVLFAVSLTGMPGERYHPGRRLFLVGGHGSILAASSIVASSDAPFRAVVAIAYVAGLTILTLNAYWAQRHLREPDAPLVGWEPVMLLAAILTMVAIAMAATLLSPSSAEPSAVQATLLKSGFLLMMSVLAAPPHPPRLARSRPGGIAELAFQSLLLTVLLNVVLLAVCVSAPRVVPYVFFAFALWLIFAVGFEYFAAWHAYRRRRRYDEEPPEVEVPPYSIVVSCMNEERLVGRTIAAAATLPGATEIVVVVSHRCTDGTLQAAKDAAVAAGARVRVVVGPGGSKADDLNAIWQDLHNEVVLLLDADETLDPTTLPWGIAALAPPHVGVVQGRKAAYASPTSVTDRLVTVERRFSTLLDQTCQADVFDAAHFAGSAAFVKRGPVLRAGGFSSRTLTEDIELTMRLYLNTHQRVVYEPRFLTREETPHDLRALVRQRSRWARGWGQVYELHFGAILRGAGRIGRRRAFGLAWQLLTSVSAPWSIFLPVLLVLGLMGQAPALPAWLGYLLLYVVLPSRVVSYGYAYFQDPHAKTRPRPLEALQVVFLAYAWMFIGWFLQMQALYLQMASAPLTWRNTRGAGKTHSPAGARGT